MVELFRGYWHKVNSSINIKKFQNAAGMGNRDGEGLPMLDFKALQWRCFFSYCPEAID